jgi:hypothetical protein
MIFSHKRTQKNATERGDIEQRKYTSKILFVQFFLSFLSENLNVNFDRIILKTAVGGEVLREHVAVAALRAFVKAHLLVRRTKELSTDAVTGSARRPDSTAVFRINKIDRIIFTAEFLFSIIVPCSDSLRARSCLFARKCLRVRFRV